MIIFGHCNRERREDEGTFECPRCMTNARYAVYRTYQYFHLYFIPLFRQHVVEESVHCDQCETRYPVSVLGRDAPQITSACETAREAGRSVVDNLGNVLALTEAAANEILRLRFVAKYPGDVVARIMPSSSHPNTLLVKFDYAMADGRDWIGQSRNIAIVVDRRDAPELHGCIVDFCNGDFCRSSRSR